MNHKYIIWATILLAIIFFQSCEEQVTPPERPFNEQLVFQNSEELIIPTTLDSNDFPIFDISSVDQQKVFIAVSTEALTTSNFEVENTDAIIWQWHSGLNAINQIKFENGELLDPNLAFKNGLCCNGDTYYWSAWTWGETGQYIKASTPIESFKVTTPTPTIELEEVVLINESGGDGYAQKKEEDITLRIYVKNTSNHLATDVKGTFYHASVLALPQTLQFGNLNSGESKYVDLDLKMPNIPDKNLEIDAHFNYNDNLTLDTLVVQHIALLPCVEEYILEWIVNDLDNMDPFSLFSSNRPADLFFTVFVTNLIANNNYFFDSGTIDNVKNQDLPVGWFQLVDCREFDLISTFTMVFKDEESSIPFETTLSSIDFSFTEFVETQNYPEVITFQNDFVHIRLKVKWQ